MTVKQERKTLIGYINETVNSGARKKEACKIIGLTLRTVQRWYKNPVGDRRSDFKRISSRALSVEEKNKVIEICNSNVYKDLSPNEIVPILAENGEYYASESTFYRILRAIGLLNHRSDCKVSEPRNKPDELKATGPNQVLSWDITYLKTCIKGIYYYLYLFMDIWSRMIAGWTVEGNEDGEIASKVIRKICREKGIDNIYLHADNGGPMKCGTMLATLQWLGVVPSFSRPHVSNDNPFSESLFKTMKYRPAFPKDFNSLDEARAWVETFVKWYNEEHHHSGIKYVTPCQRHYGEDISILLKRKETYIAAKNKRPDRWSGNIRNWDRVEEVVLNKRIEEIKIRIAA
jgi:transposase InsO family protein